MAFWNLQTKLKWQKKVLNSGASLIEILMAVALFAFLAPALLTGFIASREGKPQQQQRFQASLLLKEGLEAVRVVRENGWVAFAVNGTFHPVVSGTTWALSSGSETVNGLTRTITIADTRRDGNTIVASGGTVDPSTKTVTVTVTWNTPLSATLSSTLYITRYLDNLSFIDTTLAEFTEAGYVVTNTEVVSDSGGEIKLGVSGPGKGNWCTPSIVTTHNLPKNGAARAVTAIPFEVFAGTGENASGESLARVTVSNGTPPVTTAGGNFNGYKTNDIFGETGYAYLVTDTNNKELVIANTSSMTEVGSINLGDATNGQSIFVLNNVAYVTAGNTLYTVNVTTKNNPQELTSIGLANTGNSVYVVGDYAYIATAGTTNQLQIFNISNPSSPSSVSSFTVNGQAGRDVYVSSDGNRAYLVTAASGSQSEFFLINIENKNSPSLISSYDTNGMDPYGVDMVLSGNRAVIVGTGGEEYQVVNIGIPTAPVRCNGIDITDSVGMYDIATVIEPDGDAYAYVVTGESAAELQVIEGGPGGTFSMNGTYESPIFDAATVTMFNRFTPSGLVPAGTTLRYQVAVSNPGDGICATATYQYLGPDGTDATYFTGTAGIPYVTSGSFANPGRCLKYKAWLDTTDMGATPYVYDVTVNYSP